MHINVNDSFLTIFQEYCKTKEAYLVEIDSLQENMWIHETLVEQHFTGKQSRTKSNFYHIYADIPVNKIFFLIFTHNNSYI